MKIKFNTDDDIPLNKQLHFPTLTIILCLDKFAMINKVLN